jgi:hypothetical protein
MYCPMIIRSVPDGAEEFNGRSPPRLKNRGIRAEIIQEINIERLGSNEQLFQGKSKAEVTLYFSQTEVPVASNQACFTKQVSGTRRISQQDGELVSLRKASRELHRGQLHQIGLCNF